MSSDVPPIQPPAAAPCGSCPYRRDVPSGVWADDEYRKLPRYDGTIAEQAMAGATGVFCCHQQDGRACAGWVAVHDLDDSLAFRLACSAGKIDEHDFAAFLDYETKVPVFSSGREACDHGLAELETPGVAAARTIQKLRQRLGT